MPISGWIQYRIEGTENQLHLISDCSTDHQTCEIEGITQSERGLINLTITEETSLILANSTASIRIFAEISGHYDEHVISIVPDSKIYQKSAFWELSGTLQDPIICTTLAIEDDSIGNVTISDPRWIPLNDTSISKGDNEFCLGGSNGASISGPSDYLGRHLGPHLNVSWDDGNNSSWRVPIANTSPVVNSVNGVLKIPEIFSNTSIGYVDSTAPFCPSNSDLPEVDPDIHWNRTLGDHSFITVPNEYSGNGSLLVQEGGWLVVCEDSELISSFVISNGPDIWVSPGALRNAVIYYETSNITISNLQNVTESITISISGPPGDSWGIGSPDYISPNSNVNITVILPEEGFQAAVWVIPGDSGITVYSDIREA